MRSRSRFRKCLCRHLYINEALLVRGERLPLHWEFGAADGIGQDIVDHSGK
jgi:hypothetical protein